MSLQSLEPLEVEQAVVVRIACGVTLAAVVATPTGGGPSTNGEGRGAAGGRAGDGRAWSVRPTSYAASCARHAVQHSAMVGERDVSMMTVCGRRVEGGGRVGGVGGGARVMPRNMPDKTRCNIQPRKVKKVCQ